MAWDVASVGADLLRCEDERVDRAPFTDEWPELDLATGYEIQDRNLQARLDPETFWRVHRSHLVNINKIKEIVPWFSRNYILRMKDSKGTEIPVSRSQTKRLREYLKL